MDILRTLGLLLTLAVAATAAPTPSRYFVVQVLDDATGRGVPLVELRTTHLVRYVTDSAGVAALDEPGLEGQEVFFSVTSPGYEVPADGFGYRGVRLRVKAGETAQVRVRRLNLAERLYRVTGEGIYRDSLLAGRPTPSSQPLLNAQVVGQDTVDNAIYQGKLFWIWGDTSRLSYPLGNFHTTGATSPLPGKGGPKPDQGMALTYFQGQDGFTREMTPFSDKGPTWIDGLVTLQEGGKERLFCLYANVRQDMTPASRGLGRFDDTLGRFQSVASFSMDSPNLPRGHAFRARQGGADYLYYAFPYPLVRVKADPDALRDPSRYEAFTPLLPGTRLDPRRPESAKLDRDAAGHLRYAWKRSTSPVGPDEQDRLMRAGLMSKEEALLTLRDPDTGAEVYAHGGSVYWNAYRKRWVLITVQRGGTTSNLGEVWYAESDTPVGPWVYARKVVTHNKYSFYNPKQHPEFDEEGGRRIYFEGTYTFTFSGSEEAATPRYDYNQIMYRLDLADPRLALPVPVHDAPWRTVTRPGANPGFCAPDRPAPGLVPVYWRKSGSGPGRLEVSAERGSAQDRSLFYALPPAADKPSPATLPVYEWVREVDGSRTYTIGTEVGPEGYRRSPEPLCRVWSNRCQVDLSNEDAAPSAAPLMHPG
ncbi:MAG TPA: hypothetical protein VGN26_21115 [Armatimonadota bacterium]|jgi:hypothetical protein